MDFFLTCGDMVVSPYLGTPGDMVGSPSLYLGDLTRYVSNFD
jgi:hypothetical protein